MTDVRPPLAAFDDATFDRVSEETGVPADRLRRLARRHQKGVRELPGVEDIVYEWRNHFHMDPMVERREELYVLALPAHVWEEFEDGLDCSSAAFDALKAVHDRQARTLVTDTDRLDTDAALVLTRP
jgi:hypothetical protein